MTRSTYSLTTRPTHSHMPYLISDVTPYRQVQGGGVEQSEGDAYSRANMAHIRQSRPDSILEFHVEVPQNFHFFPLRSPDQARPRGRNYA